MERRFHGFFDYAWALALILSPWVMGFARGGMETWVPVVLGGLVIFYSLFTAYEGGIIRAMPMAAHQILDGAVGVALLFSPWALGFSGLIWLPHFIFGAALVGVALFTDRIGVRDGGR